MQRRWLVPAALLLALALLASCAAVQKVTRDTFNTDMTARVAPPLVGGAWVDGLMAVDRPRDDALGEGWVLVNFLDPG